MICSMMSRGLAASWPRAVMDMVGLPFRAGKAGRFSSVAASGGYGTKLTTIPSLASPSSAPQASRSRFLRLQRGDSRLEVADPLQQVLYLRLCRLLPCAGVGGQL